MFGAFSKIPTVFGDPSSEMEAFDFPKKNQAYERGRVIGRTQSHLKVKLEQSGKVIEVLPTDVIQVK